MLDFQFWHREVCDVRCGQYRTSPDSSRSYKAVRLVQGYTHCRVLSAPATGAPAFRDTQRGDPQRLHQTTCRRFLFGAKTPPYLFNRNCGHPGFDTSASQRLQTVRCGTPPERVDQYRRVKQEPRHGCTGRTGQPERIESLRRCARTQAAGSSSQSCPVSAIDPKDPSISSQRRSSSRLRLIRAAMNVLRRLGPALRSRSSTRSSSN